MSNKRITSSITLCVLIVLLFPTHGSAQLANVEPFLKQHCYDCHADGTTEGGLDIKKLSRDLDDEAAFATWERMFDRVNDGEMPPADVVPPSSSAKRTMISKLASELTSAHQKRKATVLRRLNRNEYENTLNDLFGTNLKLAQRLPVDGRSHEFDNVGSALSISMVQLQKYLECIDDVFDESIVSTIKPPERNVVRASYADTRGAGDWLNKVWLHRDDGAVVFFRDLAYPTGMLREATVREAGWYLVRVNGYAFQSKQPITFELGATTFARGAEKPVFGYFEFPPGKPTTVEMKVWMPERFMVKVTPYGIADDENYIRNNGIKTYPGPGLAVHWIEVEGPLIESFPSRGHKLLFDGIDRSEVIPQNKSMREKPWYRPKFEMRSDQLRADVKQALLRIAERAFRRPVTDADVAPYLKLFQAQRAEEATNEEAFRTAVAAIFCSPDFLYLRESPGRLTDAALATRLSYFLTRSAPDDELRKAIHTGALTRSPDAILKQADRLLQHPHSERFIEDFTDAWLNLRDISFTNPDDTLFPEYDGFLHFSMLKESRSFFRKLIDDNLGVRNVVQSDFAMLNSRLASHYGIDGVNGPDIRRVPIPKNSVRGGVLTQASVLKVSANGTNTSPVVRGIWVMERLLGETPSPPPPGIPGVEPDIRGATTLRELLAKHRDADNCRSCHEEIDPPGFALESFNPIGGWRDHYRSLGKGEKVDLRVNGRRVRYRVGQPVDSSGITPDGTKFTGFTQFRKELAKDEQRIARTLITKLLTFATGREMGFSDRPEINRLVADAAKTDYGLHDIIHLVITSDIFQSQ